MTYNRGSAFDLLLVRWSALGGDGAHLRLPDMAMVTMVTMATLWSLYGQWCLIVPTNERPCRVMLEIVTVRVRRGRGGARHRANCSLLSVSSVQSRAWCHPQHCAMCMCNLRRSGK